jgi:hypothetical protein
MHPERFGRYTLSSETVNGRGFYVSDFDQGAYGIWWTGSDGSWRIGPISYKDQIYGLSAYIDEQCVEDIHPWNYLPSSGWTSFGSRLSTNCAAVNCQWTSWGSWQSCSVSCGGGTKKRFRSKFVKAENGGLDCPGDNQESQNCADTNCPLRINCPSGWTTLSGTCYFFSDDRKSFSEAESFCRNRGGKLAEPKEQNTNKILLDASKSERGSSLYQYWIGIKKVGSSRKWASDGSTVAWMNWGPSQPYDSKTYERCVYMNGGRANLIQNKTKQMNGGDEKRWANSCSFRYYYICEL